jgi:hypothetical protein
MLGCGGSSTPRTEEPAGPAPMLVASDLDLAWIEADATHVYFTTADESNTLPARQIGRIPTAGGSVEILGTVPTQTQLALMVLASDAVLLALEDHRVALDAASTHTGTLRIAALAKTGGAAATPITLVETSGIDLDGLAVDDTTIYFGIWLDERTHEIRSLPRAGGEARVLLQTTTPSDEVLPHQTFARTTDRASLLAVDDTQLFWLSHQGHEVSLLAIDKRTGQRIRRFAIAGRQPRAVALSRSSAIIAYDDTLYEISKTGDKDPRLLVNALAWPRIAVSDNSLVYSALMSPAPNVMDAVLVVDGASGAAKQLPTRAIGGGLRPTEIAVTTDAIYVVDEGQNGAIRDRLWRFARP